ncbi:hypothetical protein [Lentzea sp. NPDC060358]|uniref:hypothetical protein n=1 Tax=Lentzea sp. NPDC060358 TaxID=3347103 RepID=UPI003648A484
MSDARSGLLGALGAGAGLWVFLPLGGRVSLTEAAAVLLAPPCLLALARCRRGTALAVTAGCWFAGLAVSQVLHPGPLPSAVRAFAAVIALVVTAGLLCSVLTRGQADRARPRRAVLVGFAWGQLVGLFVTPPSAAGLDLWKFGGGQAVTLLVLLAAERFSPHTRRHALPLLLLVLTAGHLAVGSRVLALVTFVALLGTLFAPLSWRRPGRVRAALLAAAVVAGALVLQHAYTSLATSGALGADQQIKIGFQDGDLGLIVGGRKDFVFLLAAVAERPVVGWGPGAVVPAETKAEAVTWLREHDYPLEVYDFLTFVRPATLYLHSVVLGSWATAGLAALPFWLLAMALLGGGIVRAWRRGGIAELFVLVMAGWHVLFSPLGDTTRGHIALALALALTAVAGGDGRGDEDARDRVALGRADGAAEPAADPESAQAQRRPGGQQHAHRGLVTACLSGQHQQLGHHDDERRDQVPPEGGDRAGEA